MRKLFVKTHNVKNFVELMNNLIDKSNEVPKMGLVYGDPGLGKTRVAVWWANRNDAVYVRAQNNMTSHGILEKIVEELGEAPSKKSTDLMKQCTAHLRLNPQVIIIDEVDYLIGRSKTIETLRDLHDLTGAPVVLIGISTLKAVYSSSENGFAKIRDEFLDRIDDVITDGITSFNEELSEIKITDEAKEIFFEKSNRFRQAIKGIATLENLAKTNGLNKIDVKQVKGLTIEK